MSPTLIKFRTPKWRRPARIADPDMRLLDQLRREYPLVFAAVVRLAEDTLARRRAQHSDSPGSA